MVQENRKNSGFDVSDRIEVAYASGNATVREALAGNREYISEQILAVSFEEKPSVDGGTTEEIGEGTVTFLLKKV